MFNRSYEMAGYPEKLGNSVWLRLSLCLYRIRIGIIKQPVQYAAQRLKVAMSGFHEPKNILYLLLTAITATECFSGRKDRAKKKMNIG
jgi:hypothetical protein